ncbi:MAG: FAD-dependent thymidylate synthase [Pseudomonadota bacterium]
MEDNQKIAVLDHGFVRLVDHMGSDLSIVRAARVSYDAEPRSDGSDDKLISYLMKNAHTSPFEAVSFTFEVKAPIFILRQWHRHRTWSYNEVSARYTELPDDFYVPALENVTTQAASNKQMRTAEQHPDAANFTHRLRGSAEECFRLYREALEDGIPRELARCFLPLNTYSRMFATVDLHNLFHFLRLRLHAHAQYEIRVYADAILALIRDVVPVSVAAFESNLKGATL